MKLIDPQDPAAQGRPYDRPRPSTNLRRSARPLGGQRLHDAMPFLVGMAGFGFLVAVFVHLDTTSQVAGCLIAAAVISGLMTGRD